MSNISSIDLQAVIAFHGHFCPGLATGIRLCGAVLDRLASRSEDEELVAIIDTANCAADAIQFVLGCSYGKGNLIHRDYGRNVYTFVRRSDGRALRMTCLPGRDDSTPEQRALVARIRGGEASDGDREAYAAPWTSRGQAVLDRPLEDLFRIEELVDYPLPPAARIEPSVACDECGALVMASRLAEVDGRRLCAVCVPADAGAEVAEGYTFPLTVVGRVRNDLSPASPPRMRSPRSRLEIDPAYAEGLRGLEVGQQVDVLFGFDRAKQRAPLLQHRRGDRSEPPRGVFALRSPSRPSPVGVTPVRILALEPSALVVEGLDAWDSSPILDIKPMWK